MNIDPRTKEILSTMLIDGNTSTITQQLDRKDYVKVNEVLETLGATWNKKQKCHVWITKPEQALKIVIGSGNQTITTTLETKKERRKTHQQFYTPDSLADRVVELADIQPKHKVLEPSAGHGALIKAINRQYPAMDVYCMEIDKENQAVLENIQTAGVIGDDFLTDIPMVDTDDESKCIEFDRIVMNPPFAKHQDITHIQHAFNNCLKSGGRLVAICSCHPFYASHKVDKAFVAWLDEIGAEVQDVDSGTFKDAGTMVASKLIIIDKD